MKKILLFLTLLVMSCGGGGGGGSAAPTTGLGISVVSNQIISTYAPDLCTQFAGEQCYFNGGQRVKFDDGSVLLTGNYIFLYSSGAGDTDSDQQSVQAFFPSTVATGYIKLSAAVARGAGYKGLFLVWTRSPETLTLVADTTGNNSPADGGDETISTVTLSNWP